MGIYRTSTTSYGAGRRIPIHYYSRNRVRLPGQFFTLLGFDHRTPATHHRPLALCVSRPRWPDDCLRFAGKDVTVVVALEFGFDGEMCFAEPGAHARDGPVMGAALRSGSHSGPRRSTGAPTPQMAMSEQGQGRTG